MKIAIVTGSAGLIGSESVRFLAKKDIEVIGIDNNMRQYFFGEQASTEANANELKTNYPNYHHHDIDIRDNAALTKLFEKYNSDISYIIHSASQPSHDWAAREPLTDFSVNATATLGLLELTRNFCPQAAFCFLSTNKVYGDTPNQLDFVEQDLRFELEASHHYFKGIDEHMSIDNCLHSLFGASKLSADVLTQEYGRYFGLNTGIFRGGCLTGKQHAGAELHGFLAYLVKCIVQKKPYRVFGYKGKQVRDNIHSYDLVNALWHFCQNPRSGEVYNIGGSRHSNCSMLEAIKACEAMTGNKLDYQYVDDNRVGDHIWWVSDISKFKSHYPQWDYKYTLDDIYQQIISGVVD